MNQSFHLYQLQKIDQQIDKADARLDAIQQILLNDEQTRAASIQAQSARAQFVADQAAQRECEQLVAAKRIKIEQSEAALYGGAIHNPKELQDLQAEIVSLKKHLAQLEDSLLEAIIKCEESEINTKLHDQRLGDAQTSAIERNASLNGERTSLLKARDTLQLEKQAIVRQLQPESLSIYEKLRLQKKGVVVATVEEDSCSVCGSEINPADRQAARSPSRIVFCAFCGRIIYSG